MREANSKRLVCFVGNIGRRMLSDIIKVLDYEAVCAFREMPSLRQTCGMNPWQRHPHAFSSTSRSHKGLETAIRYLRWISAFSSREQNHCNKRGLMHGCGLGGPSGARIPRAANSHRFYTRMLFLNAAARAVVDACSVDPPRQEWESFVPN